MSLVLTNKPTDIPANTLPNGERDVEFVSLFSEGSANGIRRVNSATDIIYKTREGQKTVNQYILGEQLGEGSYAKVREAFDTQTKRHCAIKIMKQRTLRKIPGGEEAVMNEIEILKKIHHPNCVEMLDFFTIEEKEKLYIVFDYAGGGSLQELAEAAENRRLPMCQARKLFTQLINALDYIHNLDIVHRDVKPDNMLLTVTGDLKLADFGVAVQTSQIGRSSYDANPPPAQPVKGNAGAAAFQAPELASGKETYSAKSDIWAAGITLYMITIGKFPFEGSSVFGFFENIANGAFTIPDWVHPALTDLIKNILEVDHNKRYTIAQIRAHDWMTMKLPKEPFVPVNVQPSAFDISKQKCRCIVS